MRGCCSAACSITVVLLISDLNIKKLAKLSLFIDLFQKRIKNRLKTLFCMIAVNFTKCLGLFPQIITFFFFLGFPYQQNSKCFILYSLQWSSNAKGQWTALKRSQLEGKWQWLRKIQFKLQLFFCSFVVWSTDGFGNNQTFKCPDFHDHDHGHWYNDCSCSWAWRCRRSAGEGPPLEARSLMPEGWPSSLSI